MAILNSLFASYSHLLVDSSFSPHIYSTSDLQKSPPHARALVQEATLHAMQEALSAAGVQVVLTNTYDMTRFKLAWLDCAERCAELNTRAVQMTRQALGSMAEQMLIAGNIGAANARVPYAEMVNAYAEQAEALASGGVDCLWLEGFRTHEELEAALAGCAIGSADLPIIATIVLTRQPTFITMLRLLDSSQQVVSLGIDTGNGLTNYSHALAAINSKKPLAIKGNLNALTTECGMSMTVSELWERFAYQASVQGARIIAGDESCNSADFQAMSSALSKTTFAGSFS